MTDRETAAKGSASTPAALDFHDFHRTELPRKLAAGNGALAAVALRRAKPIAFRVADGEAYTYVPVADGVDIVAGEDSATTVIAMDRKLWQDLVTEYESPPGMLYGGRVECPRGNAMDFVRWDPALRAMYTGRPIFDPENEKLLDRHGARLDTTASFHLDADPEDMAHFLRTAGYLVVREVFSSEETAGFLECSDRLRGAATKGDKKSWWGKNASGDEVLCRVTHAAVEPTLNGLRADPRIARIVALADDKLLPRSFHKEDGVSIIYKNPDMTEGLSDIPWHRDCGMGGHAVMCPVLIGSIFLTEATEETGVLRMLPGSWKAGYGYADANHPRAPAGVTLNAAPGDVAFHYGDNMHAAPPPTGPGPYRTSVVMGFARKGVRNHRGDNSYNDVLLGREDGQIEHLSKVAERL